MWITEMMGIKSTVTTTKECFWYEFRQNNSGGHFDIDDDVAPRVLIQAATPSEANARAEQVGIYFDGCRVGMDCDCCGDRWDKAWDALEDFTVYSWKETGAGGRNTVTYDSVFDYAQAVADEGWGGKEKPEVIVYFADGAKIRFYNSKEK
jgi:hypothetical protein